MNLYAISIDLGSSNVPASLIRNNGQILHTLRKENIWDGGPRKLVSRIVQSINELTTYYKKEVSDGELIGVGLACPGIINQKDGIVLNSSNLPQWNNVHIVEMIKEHIKFPTTIDNNANCAVLAEHWIGEGKGFKNIVMFTLGTGVGGGIIIDNKIYRGSHGLAGELGHITIAVKGTRCSCGNYGCLEAHVAANATIQRAKERLKRGDVSSSLCKNNLSEISAYDLYLEAEKGDRFCQDILTETGTYLGVGIAALSNIFDPDIVIIGGGFSRAAKYLIPSATTEACRRGFKQTMDNVKIVRAKLAHRAGLFGAAKMVFDSFSK